LRRGLAYLGIEASLSLESTRTNPEQEKILGSNIDAAEKILSTTGGAEDGEKMSASITDGAGDWETIADGADEERTLGEEENVTVISSLLSHTDDSAASPRHVEEVRW
jgi:hypothetical protein